MFIQTEDTPNPATLKFLPGQSVMTSGVADFKNRDEAARSPLAKRLFSIEGVQGVFLGHDFISVTKDDRSDWMLLKPHILGAIMEHSMTGLPAFEGEAQTDPAQTAPADEDELSAQIRELIDTRVRPAVAQDGGDIDFIRFEDGIVYLRMRGACAGCPSSTMTLKSGIENMLKHFVPEVLSVEQADAL